MTKPILAIDMDEVLFPFLPEFNRYYNEQHATDFKLEDYVSFDFEKVWGGTADRATIQVDAFLRHDHRAIQPVPVALEALKELKQHYQLVVVTARDGITERETRLWILHHFPDYFDDIILAGNHYTGRGYRTKSEICLGLGASMLIDDGLHNILDCAAAGVPGLLFGDYAWNQTEEPLPMNVQRVADWHEAKAVLLNGGA